MDVVVGITGISVEIVPRVVLPVFGSLVTVGSDVDVVSDTSLRRDVGANVESIVVSS